MGLQLTPISFVAGVMTEIFAYDFDHDNDDLSPYTQATVMFYPSDGSPAVPWPVDHVEYVRGYNCDPDLTKKNDGKVVGLLIYATPPPALGGCLGVIPRLLSKLFRPFFRPRDTPPPPIGTGDLGGSTTSPTKPTIAFDRTMVAVYG